MIQIDIQMPKNCGACPICNEYLMCGVPCNGRGWGENDVSDYFTNGRPEWCPIKEQEAIKPKKLKGYNPPMYTIYEYECEKCKSPMMNKQPFCMGCGRSVKWNEKDPKDLR